MTLLKALLLEAMVSQAVLLQTSGTEHQAAGTVEQDRAGCEACLKSGKSWQPEANACTNSCDIQDISCYTPNMKCPETSSTVAPTTAAPETSVGCEACLKSGKSWQPQANACTENCDIQDISCYTPKMECPGKHANNPKIVASIVINVGKAKKNTKKTSSLVV